MEVYQYVYEKCASVSISRDNIRLADNNNDEEVRFIASHYSGVSGYEYTKSRCDEGNVYVACDDDKIMGFIGFHEEGSMGILEVLPEYQRKGVATELVHFLIKEAHKRGYIPFSQAETGNYRSIAMHEKLGFSRAEKPIYWLIRG